METTTEDPQVHKLVQFRDQEPERLYWTISEVAEQLNVAPSHIRFYELDGYTSAVAKRNRKGDRRFTLPEIEELRMIVELSRWFKLNKVKQLIREGRAERFHEMLCPR